jgi:ribosomal protein S18 acetylase RimI-like enzyme
MDVHIRPLDESDIPDLVQWSLSSFAPIFVSFARILGPGIYPLVYPDWQTSQSEGIESVCRNAKMAVWVAEVGGRAVGYIAYELHEADRSGEVMLLAVHPEVQNQGIGTALNEYALRKMEEAGMSFAVVGTGGDESHAPARRSYEKAGYTALPLVRYYKKLGSMS